MEAICGDLFCTFLHFNLENDNWTKYFSIRIEQACSIKILILITEDSSTNLLIALSTIVGKRTQKDESVFINRHYSFHTTFTDVSVANIVG